MPKQRINALLLKGRVQVEIMVIQIFNFTDFQNLALKAAQSDFAKQLNKKRKLIQLCLDSESVCQSFIDIHTYLSHWHLSQP